MMLMMEIRTRRQVADDVGTQEQKIDGIFEGQNVLVRYNHGTFVGRREYFEAELALSGMASTGEMVMG